MELQRLKITTPLKQRLLSGLHKYPEDAPKLRIQQFEEMGLGIVAEAPIKAGTFIMPYSGDLVTKQEFQVKNKVYEERGEGCYYIDIETPYRGKQWVMDGTTHHG